MLPILVLLAAGFVQGPPRAHFSRFRSIDRVEDVVDIGSGKFGAAGDFRYVLKLTRRRNGGKPVVRWADSATCPVAPRVIVDMTKITMPRPAPYGVSGVSQDIVLDGSFYELSAPSTDVQGSFTIRSNDGTSMSLWIDNALERLDGCWSAPTERR